MIDPLEHYSAYEAIGAVPKRERWYIRWLEAFGRWVSTIDRKISGTKITGKSHPVDRW